MNIKELIKGFCLNVLKKIRDHIETAVAFFIITVGVAFSVIFWKWVIARHSIEFYGWIWVLLCVGVFSLVVYFILYVTKEFGRLKNPHDVMKAIEHWFARDEFGDRILTNTPYYFVSVERVLNIKRGSSKIHLPSIALKHGYVFQMGKKTFTLSKLTGQNNPFTIFEQHLKPLETGEKEVLLSCDKIDNEIGWPKGAFKAFLLRRPLKNMNFGIDIEDMGKDEIRIVRKQ